MTTATSMQKPVSLAKVSLDDKYALERGRVFLTGTQALVRLPMLQRQRDQAKGLNTGCYISGYRGSPLGGFDQQLWQAKPFLERNHIVFQPGVNEDMAATALWGSQQLNLGPKSKHDGVFGIWYGKAPGVDRCGDVVRHANSAGTDPNGGVLMLCGDDHAAVSSTVPGQSEHNLASWMVPMLYPAGVQEYLDYGLLGWAMSRFAGVWVGYKCVSEIVESSASINVDAHCLDIKYPDIEMPEGGLNIRWPDDRWSQEIRLQRYKVYAALDFARANGIDRLIWDSPQPRIGIVAAGKTYLDTLQALEDLEINEQMASDIGLRVYKVGMPWPLEKEGIRTFAEGLDEVLVIEEKRAVIENQLKEQLFNCEASKRPRVVGKFDEKGEWILPSAGELTPAMIARVIATRLQPYHTSEAITNRLEFLNAKEKELSNRSTDIQRIPYFCSGCPHNTSTKVPIGEIHRSVDLRLQLPHSCHARIDINRSSIPSESVRYRHGITADSDALSKCVGSTIIYELDLDSRKGAFRPKGTRTAYLRQTAGRASVVIFDVSIVAVNPSPPVRPLVPVAILIGNLFQLVFVGLLIHIKDATAHRSGVATAHSAGSARPASWPAGARGRRVS